jgi:hypothetical protein
LAVSVEFSIGRMRFWRRRGRRCPVPSTVRAAGFPRRGRPGHRLLALVAIAGRTARARMPPVRARTGQPEAETTRPELKPPVAPAMAMETSAMPWFLARVASGTASVIIAVPETRPRFQPSRGRRRGGGDLIPVARRVRPEAAAIGVRPYRSTSQPVSGEGNTDIKSCTAP